MDSMNAKQSRRLDDLEAAYPPQFDVTPEARCYAERVAADVGLSPDELIDSAETLMQEAGPPYTPSHVARYVSRTKGIPLAELFAGMASVTADYHAKGGDG
jgi:hypothetical protein